MAPSRERTKNKMAEDGRPVNRESANICESTNLEVKVAARAKRRQANWVKQRQKAHPPHGALRSPASPFRGCEERRRARPQYLEAPYSAATRDIGSIASTLAAQNLNSGI